MLKKVKMKFEIKKDKVKSEIKKYFSKKKLAFFNFKFNSYDFTFQLDDCKFEVNYLNFKKIENDEGIITIYLNHYFIIFTDETIITKFQNLVKQF